MSSDLLESDDRMTDIPRGGPSATTGSAAGRPALLAGEERDTPDHHIFRGTD